MPLGSSASNPIIVAPEILEPGGMALDPTTGSGGVLTSTARGDNQMWERVATSATGFGARSGDIRFASASLPAAGEKLTPFEAELQAGLNFMNGGKFPEAVAKFEAAQLAKADDYRGYFFEAVCQANSTKSLALSPPWIWRFASRRKKRNCMFTAATFGCGRKTT
ncbi:MAG: hypothetical protein QM775_13330 [Pirellulales bacterium]